MEDFMEDSPSATRAVDRLQKALVS